MYNRINQVLEQYPLQVNQTGKGRGAIICDTDQGLKIIKEYRGSEARADFLYEVLFFLRENGQERVDCIVKTKEGRTVAVDVDESVYMMRDWYEGRECDAKNRDDILNAVSQLARLHEILRRYPKEIPEFLRVQPDTLLMENEKHSRELKKVKNYINGKKKKNDFEIEFMRHCDLFLDQAGTVIELQKREAVEEGKELYGICHGDFNHHNVLFAREGLAVLNFERALYDVQIGDLSNFMRKMLEKHNWNLGLGMDMLNAYEKLRPLKERELKQLYIRLAYPEKFWKIANHYYNSSKAWICSRNLEKLNKVIMQNDAKERFLQIISYNLLF